MTRNTILIVAMAALGLAGHAGASRAAEPRPEEQVREVLLNRNADLRTALFRAWLAPPGSADPVKVRSLAGDL